MNPISKVRMVIFLQDAFHLWFGITLTDTFHPFIILFMPVHPIFIFAMNLWKHGASLLNMIMSTDDILRIPRLLTNDSLNTLIIATGWMKVQ